MTFKLLPQDVSGRGEDPIWSEIGLSLLIACHTSFPLDVRFKGRWQPSETLDPCSKVPHGHTFWDVAERWIVPTVLELGSALGLPRSKSIFSLCTKLVSYAHSDRLTLVGETAVRWPPLSPLPKTQAFLCSSILPHMLSAMVVTWCFSNQTLLDCWLQSLVIQSVDPGMKSKLKS